MAETSSLLNCRTGNRSGGSNPPASAVVMNDGRVAQLNRVADYGSAGYRFESCRGHFFMAPSSSGLGRGPLTAETRVRVP